MSDFETTTRVRSRTAALLGRVSLAASLAALAAAPSEAASSGNRTGTVVTAGGWTTFTTGQLNTSNDARATNATNNDFGVLGTFSFGLLPGSVVTGITALVEGNAAAAQAAYARTGLMPELLGLYHLFGDPAMRIR